MKIHIDIDCTPDEARGFLGLPDVKPMQKAVLDEMQKRMTDALQAMTPESLFKVWLPASIQGWEEIGRSFWSNVAAAARGHETK